MGHRSHEEQGSSCSMCLQLCGKGNFRDFFLKSDIAAGENMIEAPTNEDK